MVTLKESGIYRINLIERTNSYDEPCYIVEINEKRSNGAWYGIMSEHNQKITKDTLKQDEIEIQKALKKLEPIMQELVDRDKALAKLASRIRCGLVT